RKDHEEAYRAGVRAVQKYFGDPLYEQVKDHLRAGQWRQGLYGLLVLSRYYPMRLIRHPRLNRFVSDCLERLGTLTPTPGGVGADTKNAAQRMTASAGTERSARHGQ